MGFKKITDYNEERYGNSFTLSNDGEFADVVFLYRSIDDVMIADTHYIKAADTSGYFHCCGAGCPACSKGIRVQTKLFIPIYNITAGKIQFWERTTRFEHQLQEDVFSKYPNPADYVFRITRHGQYRDINTTYEIMGIGKNTMSYDQILATNGIKMPDAYEMICKEISSAEMSSILSSSGSPAPSAMSDYNFTPVPRGVVEEDLEPVASVAVPPINPSAPVTEPIAVEPSADPSVPAAISDDDLDDVDF